MLFSTSPVIVLQIGPKALRHHMSPYFIPLSAIDFLPHKYPWISLVIYVFPFIYIFWEISYFHLIRIFVQETSYNFKSCLMTPNNIYLFLLRTYLAFFFFFFCTRVFKAFCPINFLDISSLLSHTYRIMIGHKPTPKG